VEQAILSRLKSRSQQKEPSMKEFLNLALGLLMPMVVSWLKRNHWPDWAKVLLSLGIALLAGLITAGAEGNWNLSAIGANSGTVFALATVFYKTYFQDTSLNRRLEGGQGDGAASIVPSNH
jgi:hypothetical protein